SLPGLLRGVLGDGPVRSRRRGRRGHENGRPGRGARDIPSTASVPDRPGRRGRLITLRSGETPHGLDAESPAVLGAVARIRERAQADTSAEALGALGVTYIVSGDAAAAVKSLESASAQKPDDARLLSDLAAAYLVRAAQLDEPADIPKALESAERAIVLKDPPPEAY